MPVGPLFRVLLYFTAGLPACSQIVPLVLPAGTPLQVQIQKRIRMKGVGQQIQGRVVQPVFVFDREVIPAGSEVIGHIAGFNPINRQKRFKAVLNGDLTPLHTPAIEFDALKLLNGKTMRVKTGMASQLGVIVPSGKRMQARKKNSFISTTFERTRVALWNARQDINAEINSQPKWDRLQEEAYSRLPYHPQFLPANTRLSAQLQVPLTFGTEAIAAAEMEQTGLPPPDTVVTARLLSSVSSKSDVGFEVFAIVSEPFYSADGHLIVPEGTRLIGRVTQAQPARWFRRSGKLRLRFQKMELPAPIPMSNRQLSVGAAVAHVGVVQDVKITVDHEGGMKSIEPRTRFIAPAVQMFLGLQMLDQTNNNAQSQSANRVLRAIAGASGLGLVGSIAAQFSSEAATGIGLYGAAWSVFNHVVARGHNIVLVQDTPLQIRFGAAHE
ncbi:MAG: hypothetical protein ACJ74Z_22955 [Bryobacteraceae bacterium]